MASSMGPPILPGFSLRVQLFSSNAYGANDRPVRSFRVITAPDVTIREFCEEASRIHRINYGEPIAIKKCQDDQEFDITQSEIVGALFTSGATIRLIQASATVNIRDSVPPDSALRYDPALSSSSKKKRSRGSSVRANSSQSPTNKRQKLSNINPDKPIPSCESDRDVFQDGDNASIIPDSQENMGRLGSMRVEIPATVSPPPHPALLHPVHSEKWPTDQLGSKSVTASRNGALSTVAQSSPSRTKASAAAPAKSKSASYHIERATERGTSVSTAATSPMSADQHPHPQDRPILPNMSRLPGTVNGVKVNGRPSPKQGTIYDVNDTESVRATSSAILDKTRASLKERKSPMNKAPPQGRINKSRTPPSGDHDPRTGDQVSTAELPIAQASRRRRKKNLQPEATEKAREVAAEAAEQRIRETSEQKKREAEHAKAAELALQRKAEQERLAAEKLAAVTATAARLERERLEKMKRKGEAEEKQAAERKRAEQAELQKAKEQAEKLEKEKKKKQEEGRVQKEKEKAAAEAEAKRLREEKRLQKEKAKAAAEAEAKRLREEETKSKEKEQEENQIIRRKSSSASAESSRSESRPGPTSARRPPSSTSLTPMARKSALKSSQTTFGSSPAIRYSPSSSIASSQAPANENQRRVSFNLEDTAVTQERVPNKLPPTEGSFQKHSHSPIRPPETVFARGRIAPPFILAKKSNSSITPPPSITPKVTVKGPSPTPEVAAKNGAAPRSSTAKGKPQAAKSAPTPDSVGNASVDDEDSEMNVPNELKRAKITKASIRPNTLSPKLAAKADQAPKSKAAREQGEDVEMESGQSTPPDTRSPVVFNHNPPSLAAVPPLELSKSANEVEDGPDEQSDDDASSEAESGDSFEGQKEEFDDDDDDDDEYQDDEDEDDEDEDEDVEDEDIGSKVSMKRSRLPPKPQSSELGIEPKKDTSQRSPSLSDRESTTQDAIDQQLTSSIYQASTPSRPQQSQSKRRRLSNSTGTPRPQFKVGASLTALNEAKDTPPRSKPAMPKVVNENRYVRSIGGEESGSESESESGDDSDSESEDEEAASKEAFAAQLSQAQSVPLPDSDEDSSSGDSSDEEYKESIRNELVAGLNQMAQKADVSTPKKPQPGREKSRIAGQAIVDEEKKKRDAKYLTKYTFAQVK